MKSATDWAKELGDSPVDAFVNATGLGAKVLVGDDNMFPTRGQTITVKGEASALRTREAVDDVKYVIPRVGSGTTILGGTREKGSW